MSRLPHHHGGEELPPEPRAAAGTDRLLDYGYTDGGILAELVGAGEASGAGADDDDVGVGVGDHVHHVTASHLARHDGLLDGFELEALEIVLGGGGRGGGGHGNCGVLVVGDLEDGEETMITTGDGDGRAMEGGLGGVQESSWFWVGRKRSKSTGGHGSH